MNEPTFLLKPLGAALRLKTHSKETSLNHPKKHTQTTLQQPHRHTHRTSHTPVTIHFTYWCASHAAEQ